MAVRTFLAMMLAAALVTSGCTDMGSDLPVVPRTRLSEVVPDSGRAGDTVRVAGTGFGAARGASVVRFAGVDASDYPSWSDTAVVVVVPPDAPTGMVALVVDGAATNAVAFRVLGAVTVAVSFANDVLPILESYGCTGCHGGSGGLFVGTPSQLLRGGTHGPAVIAGDADGSLLIQKLAAVPPFGDRMPSGGPYLGDPVVQVIKDWINQGAHEN